MKSCFRILWALLLILTQLWFAGRAMAAAYPQPPAVSAFNITGFIQAATLNNPADVLSGGTVTVNGTKITIPRNTIVIMSASNISWQEVWAFAPCPWGLPSGAGPAGQALPVGACKTGGNGQTGLALSDVNPLTGKPPLTTYEIIILGNRIGNGTGDPDYVAGIVYMAQQSLNLGQGFINFIDYTTGTLHVGGVPGIRNDATDTLVQINDPVGRFGRVMSPDPRFTADTDNPTISAKTAYPMCIPREDPTTINADGSVGDGLCPQMNRPPDPATPTMPLGNFTLCNPGAFAAGQCRANIPPPPPVGLLNNALATVIPNSDANKQAPFQVGDYIEYLATLQQDDAAGTATGVPAVGGVPTKYMSAWQIIANVGIYTSPDSVPAYVNIVLTVFGVGGTPITAPLPVPQEVTTKVRTRGFFTDPTRTVDLFAVQVDPCTGAEKEVLLLGGIPNQNGGVPWGRWRDVDQVGLFPITRQWRARYTPMFTDPVGPVIAANGLTAMQFEIPVSTFITPENLVFGDPTLLVVPQNFEDFPFLAQGEGPWRNNPANIVGQLTPFPLNDLIPGGPLMPASASCPGSLAPVVKITPATQTVAQNTTVTLNASASTDPSSLPLSFAWVQQSGPAVTLTSSNSGVAGHTGDIATFKAPNVAASTAFTFKVTVTDATNLSSSGSTEVVVTPTKVFGDTITIAAGGIVYRTARGVLNATVTSSDATCSAILTLTAPGTNLPAGGVLMTPQPLTGCVYNYISGKNVFPAPTFVTVTSSLGGSATATVANGELVIK
jgi:K319-like protein